MKQQPIMEINDAGLEACAHHEADNVRLLLRGSADMRAREALDSLLVRVHEDTQRLHAASVVVDLTSLEFMNSSCIKAFVRWLSSVQDLGPGAQYKIRFLSRPELLWQRRSLHALRCFAADLVTVEHCQPASYH